MRALKLFCLASLLWSISDRNMAEELSVWPDGQRMAVSLSYDDAVSSQLDNAIPALNRHGLKGSFYLTLASPVVKTRLAEWRAAANQGHELGNHTIYHPCSASLPDRDWVASYYNIDDYVAAEIVHEVEVANSFLHAIDGKTERTFTPPCNDVIVSGENYIPFVRDLFVAIKGHEGNATGFAAAWGPAGVSGSDLINRIEQEAASGTRLMNIIFHGIGGDYLTVSAEAHEELLAFLAANRHTYWTDTYINIMKHVSASRNEQ